MTSPDEPRTESRSSVAINLTAKGDAQVSVKVYVGDSEDDVDAARALAVRTFRSACAEVRSFA